VARTAGLCMTNAGDNYPKRQLLRLDVLLRREPRKTLTAIVLVGAVFFGALLAVSAWLQPVPQTVNVRIQGKLPL
jgi:hypothetical protein